LDLSSKQHKPAFRFDFLIFSASSLYRKIRADNPIFPILRWTAVAGCWFSLCELIEYCCDAVGFCFYPQREMSGHSTRFNRSSLMKRK
jgi:hypothetical protein